MLKTSQPDRLNQPSSKEQQRADGYEEGKDREFHRFGLRELALGVMACATYSGRSLVVQTYGSRSLPV